MCAHHLCRPTGRLFDSFDLQAIFLAAGHKYLVGSFIERDQTGIGCEQLLRAAAPHLTWLDRGRGAVVRLEVIVKAEGATAGEGEGEWSDNLDAMNGAAPSLG